MSDVAYSIKISFESISIRDTGDGDSAGDVYFFAEVGGKKAGRSRIFSVEPNSTLDLKGQGYSWELRVLGSATPVSIKVDCWDHDSLSADDPLGSLTASVAPPWS